MLMIEETLGDFIEIDEEAICGALMEDYIIEELQKINNTEVDNEEDQTELKMII